jgi:hypothetical protein
LAAIATLTLVGSAQLSAHRLDQYLQAARIGVGAHSVHLEMSLTPGVAVADQVIREIDRDGDGVMSEAEQRAYAGRVLAAITLRVDDAPALTLKDLRFSFPDEATVRCGNGVISLWSDASLSQWSGGHHRVQFRNGFGEEKSVYLANALVPDDDRIAVTGQERRVDQSELTIAFSVRETDAPAGRYMWIGLLAGVLGASAGMISQKTRRSRAIEQKRRRSEAFNFS